MEKEIKSGNQILNEFFNEIEQLPDVDMKIAEVFKSLYDQGKLTDINLKNELHKLRESDGSVKN